MVDTESAPDDKQGHAMFDVVSKPIPKAAHVVTKSMQGVLKRVTAAPRDPSEDGTNEGAATSNTVLGKLSKGSQQAYQTVATPIKKRTRKVVQFANSELHKIPASIGMPHNERGQENGNNEDDAADDGKPALPPDETLSRMDLIMTKKLTNMTIQDFFETFWDGNGDAFYGTWLAESKMDVHVEDWAVATAQEEPITGVWDQEAYQQKRVGTFQFQRTTHLFTASPIADVQHTQYLRTQGNDRCVVTTTMKMDGIPFCDCFNVHVRWVVTRAGKRDLVVKVGLFVEFVKQVLVAGKIRAGTTEETTKSQLDLFSRMKQVSGSKEEAVVDLSPESVSVELLPGHPASMLSFCFPFFKVQAEYSDDIDRAMHEVKHKFAIVRTLPAGAPDGDIREFVRSEFTVVQEALDHVLVRNMGIESSLLMMESTPEQKSAAIQDVPAKIVNAVAAPFEDFYDKYIRRADDSMTGKGKNYFGNRLMCGNEEEKKAAVKEISKADATPAPDKVLQAMNVIITKAVEDASVKDFYGVCLSQFYENWLCNSGKQDLHIGEWETAKDGAAFVGEWDKERYSHKREVTFTFQRTSLILQGPPTASVKHIRYCRVEGSNRCVLAMTIVPQGSVPFSDCFSVQIRWVATRVGAGKLAIKVGLFVVFSKKILLASKIRAAAIQEGTKQQLDMYRSIKAALIGPTLTESIHTHYGFEERMVEKKGPMALIMSPLESCLPLMQKMTRLYPESTIEEDDEFFKPVKKTDWKIRAVESIVNERDPGEPTEDMHFYLSQLDVAREALDNIILRYGDEEQGPHTIAEANFEVR
jgi:hypothetical protein